MLHILLLYTWLVAAALNLRGKMGEICLNFYERIKIKTLNHIKENARITVFSPYTQRKSILV